mmetsp:Transcript_25657/g.61094  ORF Transcript_25657/g.61094 Transcript_25657/m.61094 type:complete len:201 (-) Transcript_25657:48-650(-)
MASRTSGGNCADSWERTSVSTFSPVEMSSASVLSSSFAMASCFSETGLGSFMTKFILSSNSAWSSGIRLTTSVALVSAPNPARGPIARNVKGFSIHFWSLEPIGSLDPELNRSLGGGIAAWEPNSGVGDPPGVWLDEEGPELYSERTATRLGTECLASEVRENAGRIFTAVICIFPTNSTIVFPRCQDLQFETRKTKASE